MHKTIYIDIDEEVTSVIDRIRSEIGVEEIFLVIPKEALLTHGIINLKILKREAERLGKKIIISTSDEQVKKVIGRLGIASGDIPQPMQEGAVESKTNQEDLLVEQASQETIKKVGRQANNHLKREHNLVGSDKFFNENNKSSSVQEVVTGETVKRNINLTSFGNSGTGPDSHFTETNKAISNESLSNNQTKIGMAPFSEERNLAKNKTSLNNQDNFIERQSLIGNKLESENKKRRGLKVISLGLLVVLALGGVFWFIQQYPKLEIIIYPRKKELQREVRVSAEVGKTEMDLDQKIIPGRIIEIDLIKEKEFDSTGETFFGDDGRAKGSVSIVNEYSSSSQPLVVTTRILSKEGKLFRLSEGVTVPGMKEGNPGKVNVSVVADKPGEDFNIEATTFTIEGFKGSDKYEKFKVSSSLAMKGGGVADESKKRRIISEEDLKKARKTTIKELEDEIANKIQEKIGEKDRIILESIDNQIEEAKSSYPVKAKVDKFTYTVKEKVKAIIFSEEEINEIGQAELTKEAGSDFDLGKSIELVYKKGIADFDQENLIIHLGIKAESWSKIDLEKIKNELANKKEKEIKEFLSSQATISKAEILFHPSWFRKTKIKKDKIILKKSLE